MRNFTMEVAGRCVGVSAIYEKAEPFCWEYRSNGELDFTVTMNPSDIELEQMQSEREARVEGRPAPNHSPADLEITAIQRKIAEKLMDFDTLLFHGSVVAVEGECYLFTAKSGTGKSTHTRLWRERLGKRAVMVNDDKPFLHIGADQVIAYGTPWNGKHHLGENVAVPLKAICILERGAENQITPITAKEALPLLFQQSHRPQNPRLLGKYLELLDAMTRKISFYRLRCNMNPEAAVVSYEAMSGKKL